MVEAFRIPISFELDAKAKSFVDDLKKSVSGVTEKVKGGAAGGGGALAGGIAGGLVGAGLGSILGIAEKILSNFKSLMNLVSVVVKVVVEFLRPIADVIMLLLLPVLQILKPILVVVRQIMAPFRQIAFKLSKEGAAALREGDTGKAAGLFGLSITQSVLGLNAVVAFLTAGIIEQLTTLSGEVLKLTTELLGNLFRPLLEFFGVNVDQSIQDINSFIDSGIKNVNDAIKVAMGLAISAQQLGIVKLAEKLGVDISTEYTKVNDVLSELLVGEENSFISTFDDMTSEFESSLIKFDDALLGPNSIVAKVEEAARRLNGDSGGGGSLTFGGGISSGGSKFLSAIGFQGQSTRSGVVFTRPPASNPFS